MEGQRFRYQPFESSSEIRILTLQPAEEVSEPLAGTLSVERLDGRANEYDAISYVWGDPARSTHIICNGAVLTLTKSIHDALTRVRDKSQSLRLWADQICINQDDIAERSQQVELMNLVYKSASNVLVWLGRDDNHVAEAAVKMIKYLDGVFADPEAHTTFQKAHSEHLAQRSSEPWLPLAELTKLPWFHRIWIVQEIGTSTPATLYWGNVEMDWEMLSRVVAVLNKTYHHLRRRFYIGTPNIRYLYRRFVEPEDEYDQSHNRGNFVYELHRARHMLADDPRDHVYAFLGHFSLSKGSPALARMVADYSRPVGEVYCDVAIRGLTDADSLIMLSANHNSNRLTSRSFSFPEGDSISHLPSWVPDWRELPRHIIGSPQTPHCAGGDTKPRLTVDRETMVLSIDGVHCDTVARCGWEFSAKSFAIRQPLENDVAPIESLWRRICGYDTPINSDEPYLHTPDSAFYALMQTITNACIGMDCGRPYKDMPPTEWFSHAAAYLVRASGSHTNIGQQIRDVARKSKGNAFKWSHEATLVTRYRSFAVTAQGYYVLGPENMREGDVVAVLYGGRTPFLLRRRGEYTKDGWALIGECYVHGLMNGEALNRQGVWDDTFSIH